MKVARTEFDIIYKVLAVALFILIVVTGHLGGSLTHGTDYISFNFNADNTDTIGIKPIANVQEAKAICRYCSAHIANEVLWMPQF